MVTHQLQVELRTAKAHRPKTDVIPLDHATNYCGSGGGGGGRGRRRRSSSSSPSSYRLCVERRLGANLAVILWGHRRWIQKAWLGARSGVRGGRTPPNGGPGLERRIGSLTRKKLNTGRVQDREVRQPKTDVLPLFHATNRQMFNLLPSTVEY